MTDESTFKVEDLEPIWGLVVKQDWVIEDFIPAASVTMLSGESGSGKSTVSLALADAVVSGKPFLGRKTHQRPVLIVDKENSIHVYHERLSRLSIKENPELRFWGQWSPVEPKGPDQLAILRYCQEAKPLIIFDSFIAFHTGSEQDATETRTYMEGYRRLAGLGATVILIHHTGKADSTKEYRGSSDIKASLDVGLTLIAKKPMLKLLQLKPFKNREGMLDPILIAFEGEEFQVVDSSYVTQEDSGWKTVVGHVKLNPGLNQISLIKSLPGISAERIRKILVAAQMKGEIDVVKGNHNTSFYYPGTQKSPVEPS